ncbi:MAG: DUF1292 domain-containing protein [Tissierellia bacterium]|nr:DUF1292 domain-containing protein [Tissierellia bacterium]
MENIVLYDGDREVSFQLLDTFGVDDKEYAALLNTEDEQVYIMEIEFEGDEAIFKTIDNKKVLDEVLSIYIDLLDENVDEQ